MPRAPRVLRPRKRRPSETPRPSANDRGYTWKWRKRSKAWLAEQFAKGNVFCGWCGKILDGDRSTIVVDHIIDHKGNDELFWNEKNWQALHKSPCHGQKTVRDH